MTRCDHKNNLKLYLQGSREAFAWKSARLSEYDIRRPMVPTCTNLLGLVKHKGQLRVRLFLANDVTLHEVLVHVVADTQRLAGRSAMIRELIDGAVALPASDSNVPSVDQQSWVGHRDRLGRVAQEAERSTADLPPV